MKRSLLLLPFLPALWLLIALYIPVGGEPQNGDGAEIRVFDYGYHTSLVFPADRVSPELRRQLPGSESSEFYEFAWGERKFFTMEGFSWLYAARALFTPCSSVLYVRGFDTLPERILLHEHRKFRAGNASIGNAMKLIENSFARDGSGRIQLCKEGGRSNSAYFLSGRTYWFYNNCNVWTAEVLRTLGQAVPLWAGTSGSIMRIL